jgi:sensor histidine kinase YesM
MLDSLVDFGMAALFASVVVGWFYLRARNDEQRAHIAAAAHEATLARLVLLQSQLEPHMLFNTLANLRALIATDPARAQAMLDRLIDFLRATLAASRAGAHPLADEFARIGDYLALMQVRMGERLRTTSTLPAGLARVQVPPLLLQPLVENAIKHGLEPQRGAGELHLEAFADGATLVLRVADSGRGLEAAAAAKARDEGSPGAGFGLAQVRERLHTLYGDAAAFTLAPRPGGGTLAEIRMPIETTE